MGLSFFPLVDANFLRGELARAMEFASYAENPSSITEIERIVVRLGLDSQINIMEGFEDDEYMG